MDEASLASVARLHADCLPDSLVGAFGQGYTRAFYRYIDRSPLEMLAVDRDADDRPVAAAVLSLEPATLTRRLLRHTPLLTSAITRLPRLIALWLSTMQARRRDRGTEVPATRPQLILIFTAAGERGRGRGSALIRSLEERLRARGITEYEVRTESDASNPALAFYRRRGFEPNGASVRLGTSFQVFRRSLAPVPPSSGPGQGPQ